MHKTDLPGNPPEAETDFDTFRRVDIRVGTILEAAPLEGARKPAIRLLIDFGEGVGTKKSSAQITVHYKPEDLVGRQVLAVVNFPPRQIGPIQSEILVLGASDPDGAIILLAPDKPVPNGARMH